MNDFLRQLGAVIRHLSIIEVADVAVVAVVLYLLLRLLRGTQGTQIVVGLILLAVIGVVATQFNLILLAWLFRNATFYIIIAIIVMFQPELRRVLDQLGRIGHIGRPLSGYNTRLYSQAISEAIRATERLSNKKTGALIAFEREVGLEDYAATGVRINGEISAEVLQSIFYPNSPLHDGAVIVRGNKIVAAGCLLPLPEEGVVRERLGTRHRAALGLSLASDALVLVVSEETGNISVIEEGKITRNLDADGLRRRVSLKVPSPIERQRLPEVPPMSLITDDWRLKLLAVGLAVLMLGAVAFSQNPPQTKTFTVPVSVTGGSRSRADQPADEDHRDGERPRGPDRVDDQADRILAMVDATKASPGPGVKLNVVAKSLVSGVSAQQPAAIHGQHRPS